ncbi:MAG TPA: type VI secretion system baseplate subunit TssE [Candidatus Sulfopaludibacter sp.]|jgi:type VI secretion system lysozyme-like protein|nr:type VI secretion system baseplate subunit TssE [Candidatus Sulfopaludibacter sp.]
MARHALLIGISEYDSKVGKLKKSISDIAALASVLRDPERGNFVVEEAPNCTKQDALKAISRLTQGKVHGETILLYFSGHGIRDDDGNLYLALSDTKCDDLWATGIVAPEICRALDKCWANQQLVILDCCHSGSFSADAKATNDSVGTKEIFLREGKGRVVLTASDAPSLAFESGGDATIESLFTHYLVRGIESGDADLEGDALIDTDELYGYVHREVTRERRDQHPMKFGQGQEGKLIVSRAPVRVRPLPDAVLFAVTNPIKDIRVAIVATLENSVQQGNPGERIAAYAALRSLARDDSREVSAVATGALKRNGAPPGFVEEETEKAAAPAATETEAAETPAPTAAPEPVAAAPAPVVISVAPMREAAAVSDEDREEADDSRPASLLSPSILDRLIDEAPMESSDRDTDRYRASRQSMNGLHRDLANLLNSIAPLSDDLAEFPEAQGSVLNYGLPEIETFERYTPGGHRRIALLIRDALRRFEPRLGQVSVTVADEQAGPSSPRFKIQAVTQADFGKGPIAAESTFTVNFDSGPAILTVDK